MIAFTYMNAQKYRPSWTSLKKMGTPEWLQNGKFGIYTHRGPYVVHAYCFNTTRYSYAFIFRKESKLNNSQVPNGHL
jgi:alpha-L-fucosidase